MPSSYLDFRKNVYSQCGEDGVIEKLFADIGTVKRTCCEFGAWDGIYLSNCRRLIEAGWEAVMIEGDAERAAVLQRNYADNPRVHCVNRFVDAEANSVSRICRDVGVNELDFLSIDIDGLDYEVLSTLDMRPRVICIETSAVLDPESKDRIDRAVAAKNVNQSLGVYTDIAASMGYGLVCFTGNAFFVLREDMSRAGIPVVKPLEAYLAFLDGLESAGREHLYLANLGLAEPWRYAGNALLSASRLGIKPLRSLKLTLGARWSSVRSALGRIRRQVIGSRNGFPGRHENVAR